MLFVVATFGVSFSKICHSILIDLSIEQFKFMGANQQRQRQLAVYRPPIQNYTLAHVCSPLSIYRHQYTSEEIMEFKQNFYHTQDIDRKLKTFTARYQHAYLVASLYLQLSGTDTCGAGEYEIGIYYQRVVTNLSKINDIPFIDSLHCMAVALKGFQILFRSYGYFQIFQDMFHICQRGKMKVWCNKQIYKNVPEQYLLGGGREEDMVTRVINIIDMNTDPNGKLLSLKDSLMSIDRLTFANAMTAFRQICRQNHFYVSQYLESLHNAAQIQNLLDIYGPLEDKPPKEVAMTFYPKKDVTPPSKTAEHVRSGSSSRRSQNRIQEERGRSLDVSRHRHGFQLTIAQQDFPQFVVNRHKSPTLSKSRSSPQTQNFNRAVCNLPLSSPQIITGQTINLQQFNRNKLDGSRLRKRNMLANQPSRPVVRFVQAENSNKQLPQNSNNYKFEHARPNIPQEMEVSLVSPMISRDSQQFTQNIRRDNPIMTQPPQILNQIQTVKRQTVYPIHCFPNSNSQPLINKHTFVRYLQPAHQKQFQSQTILQVPPTMQIRQPSLLSNQYNSPAKRNDFNQQSRYQQTRGLSVPLTPTWKTPTTPPEKQKINKQIAEGQSNSPSNQHSKLLTLGEGSVQKTRQVYSHKEDRFNLPQLQSKIELLSSFADNRITTQQFLPNQSRALSNVKFDKSINSGRDSVSSVFRRDLLEQSRKGATKRAGEGETKQEDEMGTKRQFKGPTFDYNHYETDPKLLELIKSTTATYKASQFAKNSSFQDRFRKYQIAYPKSDKIKQVFKEETTGKQGQLKNQLPDKFTPIFSGNEPYDPTVLRHKHNLFINKISEISENWEEQNICSTSQGSRKQRTNFATATLDEDILADMAKMGMAVGRKPL